jgi:hypothetical protein
MDRFKNMSMALAHGLMLTKAFSAAMSNPAGGK